MHLVCSVWPGSDGRRIAMTLLRRWFQADVFWVTQSLDKRLRVKARIKLRVKGSLRLRVKARLGLD